MKKQLFILVFIITGISAFAQTDSSKSVVISENEVIQFESEINSSGSQIQGSGVTQIMGIVFAGAGLAFTLANFNNPKPGFRIGSYFCFGFSGALTITSAGLKIAGGGKLKNTLLKRNPILNRYPILK